MIKTGPTKPRRRRTRKRNKASASVAVSQSPLFKLSGEVRNIIWRLAVVQPDPVVYSDAGIQEPALLLTCHAIRKEVAGLFYLENDIVVRMVSVNARPLVLLSQRLTSLGLKYKDIRTKPRITHKGSARWSNILRWLQAIFTGELSMCPVMPIVDTVENSLIHSLFATVGELRKHPIPWSAVAELLELQHRTINLSVPGWEDDSLGET